ACDLIGKMMGGCQQDRRGQGVVFGLRKEVGSDVFGIGAFVGNDHRLGRAVDGVDADIAEDLLLGDGDEKATRPGDLVDTGDRLGAVGEGSDALCAAGLEYAVDASDISGDELHGGDGTVCEDGAGDVDLVDAGNARGD